MAEKTAETVLADARANNEPVFVLRAKDLCALRAINEYIRECAIQNCKMSHMNGIINIEKDFINWKKQNAKKMKLPD